MLLSVVESRSSQAAGTPDVSAPNFSARYCSLRPTARVDMRLTVARGILAALVLAALVIASAAGTVVVSAQ
jgi:hypothetical protein